ncbi:hypothetical protein [Nocardia terpenica]|uniref:Uncharacterized protein n=1 Tax=Nocardia terpenica TaxID=455432 RepID=A0A291RYV4_9NOCA|nr:hypothetical protein [Nocardia terpenica]ATL72479.1 hypothetical protein CRH09_39585 [Nocardia terpenica]
MIDRHIRGHRTIAIVAAALALVALVAVAGCGRHDRTAPATTTSAVPGPAAPAGVDDRDPDQVLAWVAARVYSWRPGEDSSPAASFDRARPLLDPVYIRQVGASAAGLANVTGGTWARWRADKAVVSATARVTGDDHPADTPTSRQRVVAIAQHVTDPAAPSEPDRMLVAYMIVTRQTGTDRWRVSMVAPR